MSPLHRWIWRDPARRARKLLRFSATEADGATQLARAAERTSDARLRRLLLRHASDEERHARCFRTRALELGRRLPAGWASGRDPDLLAPGERGLEALRVDDVSLPTLLAFLHLSERAAAERFAAYRKVLAKVDPETSALFADVLDDEVFHMRYTETQLRRIAGPHHRRQLWLARMTRLWRAYLGLATAVAAVIGTLVLTLQYFLVVPLFVVLLRRSARAQRPGFVTAQRRRLESQY